MFRELKNLITMEDAYSPFRIIKMEVDYSFACDEKIPVAKELAKNEKTFHEAIDVLLQVEKDARMVRFISNIQNPLLTLQSPGFRFSVNNPDFNCNRRNLLRTRQLECSE